MPAGAAAAPAPAAAVDYFLAFADRAGACFAPYLDPVESAVRQLAFRHFPSQAAAAADFLGGPAATSPHARRLPLMNPFHVAVIVLAYFAMVFAGKALMAPRAKFQAKAFSLLHNTFLTALSAYMCFGILAEAIGRGYSLFGNAPDHTATGWPVGAVFVFDGEDDLAFLLLEDLRVR
ncbi:MAG: hypothetical protein BJ554DRAFT_3891 [Olpidium bornovanus]|uniref:Very-long-chain 3-oxoacyl-CoA synthase n=1 Tax=Olpidium bornovanus TaxID=278681 RepID=A0A8H8DFX2_9FUNG|nr:MAG: hypothetical protein BJ554DRAFT_3891 [Olpidium bornovanus]